MAESAGRGRWLVCLTSVSMAWACHGHSSSDSKPGADVDGGSTHVPTDAGNATPPYLDAAASDASAIDVSPNDAAMDVVDASPACLDTCTDLSANTCHDGKQQGCVKTAEGCRAPGERTCSSGRCADSARCLELRQIEWGTDSNNDTVVALSFDGKGSLYVAANTLRGLPYPEVEPGPKEKTGRFDPYLIRMNDQGRSGWLRVWGRPEYDNAAGVVGLPEGGALALASSDDATFGSPNHIPDFLLARFTPEGTLQNTSYWPTGTYEVPTNVGLAPNGDALLVGSTDGDLLGQLNAGSGDGVLMRVSTDGSLIAITLLGTNNRDILHDVAADADSNAYVMGTTWTYNGSTTWIDNAFIAKVDPTGTVRWQRTWREDELGTPSAMVLAHDRLYVVGSTLSVLEAGLANGYGQSDGYLAQLSLEGDLQWVRQWGGPGADHAVDLALEPSGSLVVVGDTQGGFAGRELADPVPNEYSVSDVYLLRWSEDGVRSETIAWGAPADLDAVSSVSVAPDGTIAVGGQSGAHVNGERIIGYPDARVAFISAE